MSTLPAQLRSDVEKQLLASISKVSAVGGGSISNAAIVSTKSNDSFFLKWNDRAPSGFFSAEAHGLSELRTPGVITVPEVLAVADEGAHPFILLELLQAGAAAEVELGEKLAALHRVTQESYGFERSNFIGSLRQTNDIDDDWGSFFFVQRLMAQAELGKERGWFDAELEEALVSRESDICNALNAPGEPASLLHGDLWSGNVYWSNQGPALIDPAVYYGSREADLAFTELFGGFGSAFYQAYNEAYPLASGYEQRKTILNLYHLMTHSNLFGGSYINTLRRTLSTLVC